MVLGFVVAHYDTNNYHTLDQVQELVHAIGVCSIQIGSAKEIAIPKDHPLLSAITSSIVS